MTEPSGASAHGVGLSGRPTTGRLWWGQVRHADRDFWRTPVAAFLTLVLPLSYFMIISAVVGNETLDDRSGIRLAQFLAPVFAVFGVVMATFAALAMAVAQARDERVLKRLRGTPLPPWLYLAGRIGSAIWVSTLAVAVLVGVGVVFYGVQVPLSALPGMLVTLGVGAACFASLGLAVVALSPTATAAQAATLGVVIPLAFISDMFSFADLPPWLDTIGWLFPLRHFVNAMADAFNPYLDGPGLYGDHLLVMIVWGVAGALVAARWFRWEPSAGGRRAAARPGAREGSAARAATLAGGTGRVSAPGRPSAPRLLAGQVTAATRATVRDRLNLFWALLFPVALVAFFSLIYSGTEYRGVPLAQYIVPAFAVYGIAVACYVNLPEAVATARDRGALKRMRGTPLPPWAYLAGRLGAALVTSGAIMAVMFTVGILFLDVRLSIADLPALALTVVVATATFGALGLALVALAGSVRTVAAVGLGTLLPLTFVSEIFLIGSTLPPVMNAVGNVFPLKHLALAAFFATDPTGGGGIAWRHLGVALLWAVAAGVLAWRKFRWESSPDGAGRQGRR